MTKFRTNRSLRLVLAIVFSFAAGLPWLVAQEPGSVGTVTGGVQPSRAINTTAPLSGGGTLAADRTLSISAASSGAAGSMSATDKAKLDAATNANTASAIVQRDSSGNFTAGTITAALTGTASNNALSSTTISTSGTGLSGGGSLASNRTITLDQTALTLSESQITNLTTDLAAKVAKGDVTTYRQGQVVSVNNSTDHGADSATTRGQAIVAAVAASQAGDHLVFGPLTATIASALAMLDNQTWEFRGSIITKGAGSFNCINITGKANCAIGGHLYLKGTASGTENGIAISGNGTNSHRIQNVTAWAFNVAGFAFTDSDVNGTTGRMGGFYSNLLADGCTTGFVLTSVDASNGAEYSQWTTCEAKACGKGWLVSGGNNQLTSVSAVQCTDGFEFKGGSGTDNHLHSYVSGITVNHCGGTAVHFNTITFGMQVSNLVSYANASNSGKILFTACSGVHITGGQIAAPVEMAGTMAGMCSIRNCDFSQGNFSMTATAARRAKLMVQGCQGTTATTWYSGNDVMPASVSTATIASGVIDKAGANMSIDTEASAASDDLDTITATYDGDQITFRAANSARDVVFKDGTGNLRLNGDFTANNVQDSITLKCDGTDWIEMYRSDNGA